MRRVALGHARAVTSWANLFMLEFPLARFVSDRVRTRQRGEKQCSKQVVHVYCAIPYVRASLCGMGACLPLISTVSVVRR